MSAAALAALVLALVPATARATTYQVELCADPQASGFVAHNSNPAVFDTTAACPWAEGVRYSGVFAGVKQGTTGMANGAAAGWTLTAPTGTSFREVTVRRRQQKLDRDYEIAMHLDGRLVEGCAVGVRCWEAVAESDYELTRELALTVRCARATCSTATGVTQAWAAIESGTATIDDPRPPAIAPATANAWQRTPDVTVSATDASGVASLTLKSGDRTLGSTALACDYRHLRPCPGTGSATFTVDLPDGTYPLTAHATDAASQPASSPAGTLMLDRVAPTAPTGLTVRATPDGRYAYRWTNPDQGDAAPIAAAHLSDGTVVRATNIQQLESASPVERIYLEDEAGNADPGTARGVMSGAPLQLNPPILQSTTAPKIRLTSAKRQGRRLLVRGTVANATTSRVTATLKRGSRTTRKSATIRRGRFTIRITLNATMRRKGKLSLTVRHGTAKATKRVRF